MPCNMRGRSFFRKMNISAFSAVSLLLFSSIMLEAVLKSLSLSTLVEGAQRNLAAVNAKEGSLGWLTFQYSSGLSERRIVGSLK